MDTSLASEVSSGVQDDTMEMSSRLSLSVLNYLVSEYGQPVADRVLAETGLSWTYVNNPDNWTSFDFQNRLLERAVAATGNPQLPHDAWCSEAAKPRSFGVLASFIQHLGSPATLYRVLAQNSPLWCKVGEWEILESRRSGCSIRITYRDQHQHRLNCMAIQGALTWGSRLFGLPPAKITHPECECDGFPGCVYEISWEEWRRRIFFWVGLLLGGVAAGVALLLSGGVGLPVLLLLLGMAVGMALDSWRLLLLSQDLNTSTANALRSQLERTAASASELHERVEARTRDLDQRNADLRRTVAELHESQAKALAAERGATVGVLAAGMAHEINSPVNTIALAAQRLGRGDLEPGAQDDLLGSILRASARCSRIIDDLLSFSRDPQKTANMDLFDVVNSSVALFRDESAEGIRVLVDLPRQPSGQVVEGAQIQQALLNILSNAAQSMSQCGTIEVRGTRGDTWASVTVRDHGMGMDQETARQVFEPFFSTKPAGEGIGLGLALTADLVRRNNGRIGVETEQGKGSAFSVVFGADMPVESSCLAATPAEAMSAGSPLPEVPTPMVPPLSTASGEELPSPDTITLLLVDDEVDLRGLLAVELREQGFTVREAGDPGEAAVIINSRGPLDAVVSDLRLGSGSGLDVLQVARERRPPLPVVMITGHGGMDSAVESLRRGASDYITKPIASMVTLVRPVRLAVARDRLMRKNVELGEKLSRSRERLVQAGREMEFAEARERQQLAQALHDSVCQLLAVIAMNINQFVVPHEQQALLTETGEYLQDSMNRVRSLMFEVSPVSLYEAGLAEAFKDLGEELERHRGLTVAVRCDDTSALPESVSVPLFRMARELLINVSKHAGVSDASLALEVLPDRARVCVSDAGAGFTWNPEQGAGSGYGIWSLQDRVAFYGGEFSIETEPGRGTTATVVLPLAIREQARGGKGCALGC